MKYPLKWLLALSLACLLFGTPLVVIFSSLLHIDGDIWQHLYQTLLTDYIVNSLILMCGTGICALLWGVLSAWFVTMYRFPGCAWLEWALLLPLAMPAYLVAYSYVGLLDVGGPVYDLVQRLTGLSWQELYYPDIRTLGGAVLLLSLTLYPYIYLLVRSAFLEQSLCVLEISRTLGCTVWRRFFRVALPLCRPAMMAGLALVLMETLADYGTVQYFGIPVFTTGIFRTWFGLGDRIAATQLSALLTVFVLLLLATERWSRRQQHYHHTSSRYSTLHQQVLGSGKGIAVAVFCWLPIAAGFLLPAGYLLILLVQSDHVMIDANYIILAWHSFSLAALSAGIAVILALMLTYGNRLAGGRLSSFAVHFIGSGYALPGTVIAIGVLIPFSWLDNTVDTVLRDSLGVSSGLLLSGSLFILVFAYLVRYLAVALQTADAALKKIKPAMDEIARCHKMSFNRALLRVHTPLMRSSLLTALLLVFVDVLKELPATLILRPFNYNTLAIRAYELANEERLAEAALPALSIVIVGILPVILLSLGITRSRPGTQQIQTQSIPTMI